MPRIIKRYVNRRLYDTEQKRMITLDDLSRLIKKGVEIQVIDNSTGEDITVSTLTQILAAQTRGWQREAAWSELLEELIRKGGVDMLDLVRKAILAGIGAMDLARERGEKIVNDLIKRGETSEDERAKFVRGMIDKAEKRATELRERIDERIEKAMPRFMRARDEQIAELSRKIDELSKKVGKVQG